MILFPHLLNRKHLCSDCAAGEGTLPVCEVAENGLVNGPLPELLQLAAFGFVGALGKGCALVVRISLTIRAGTTA